MTLACLQTICLWDVASAGAAADTLAAREIYTGHSSIVEDVQWHPLHESLFGSVGDDKNLMMYVHRLTTPDKGQQWLSIVGDGLKC